MSAGNEFQSRDAVVPNALLSDALVQCWRIVLA